MKQSLRQKTLFTTIPVPPSPQYTVIQDCMRNVVINMSDLVAAAHMHVLLAIFVLGNTSEGI